MGRIVGSAVSLCCPVWRLLPLAVGPIAEYHAEAQFTANRILPLL